MQTPRFVRPLTPDEQAALAAGLRSPKPFTVRRCQILLASSEGQPVPTIARVLRCNEQTVRNALDDFEQRGLAALDAKPTRPNPRPVLLDAAKREQLRALLHLSPRAFDKPTSLWTLKLAAEVSFSEGLTPREVSDETIRQALIELGVGWKRAKHWITSPDPEYTRKKTHVTD